MLADSAKSQIVYSPYRSENSYTIYHKIRTSLKKNSPKTFLKAQILNICPYIRRDPISHQSFLHTTAKSINRFQYLKILKYVAMSSNFCKHALLTFQLQHEIRRAWCYVQVFLCLYHVYRIIHQLQRRQISFLHNNKVIQN